MHGVNFESPRIFSAFKSLKPMRSNRNNVSRDEGCWTLSLEAWESENTLVLPFTRCEKITRLADYRVSDVYSRCKIIRWFFSNAYDPQCRLIGSHSRLFCSNLYGLRFLRIFASNCAKDAFLRDADKDNTQRNVQNSRMNTRVSFHRFWIPGCPSVLEFVRGGTSSDEGSPLIPLTVDHDLDSLRIDVRCSITSSIFHYESIFVDHTLVSAWIERGVTD